MTSDRCESLCPHCTQEAGQSRHHKSFLMLPLEPPIFNSRWLMKCSNPWSGKCCLIAGVAGTALGGHSCVHHRAESAGGPSGNERTH